MLCAVIVACSQEPTRPDLARLYRIGSEGADTTPVIVIPGLFGSRLRDRTTGAEIWPGSTQMILFDDYHTLRLDFDRTSLQVRPDNNEAFGITDAALGRDFYGQIIEALQRFGGYVKATPGTPSVPGERRYYLYPYDWRQDNVDAARGLDRLIETLRRDYNDPALRVDIIAHSMGGLVARYYLRYGPVDVLDGSEQLVTLYGTTRVRKLILLGTPNMGAASALHAFLVGEPIGFKRIPQEVLATLPSGYQLFPHPLVTWLIDSSGAARNAAGIPTPISRRCADTSIFGWSAPAAFFGRCRRRSPRRRYATCCSEATARLPRRDSPSRTKPGHPWRGCTPTISGAVCPAYATMSSCSSPATGK